MIGVMPGITSGLRTTKSFGKMRRAQPQSGISIGPRARPGPVPSPKPQQMQAANTGSMHAGSGGGASVPKPAMNYGRGLQGSYI